MKTRLLLIFAIFALLLVTLYVVVANRNAADDSGIAINDASMTNTVVPEELSGVGTLEDLRARNTSLECSISYSPNEFEPDIEGSFFAFEGAVRGDFVVEDSSLGQIVTSYIKKGDTVYVWSQIGNDTFGVKAAADAEISIKEPIPANERVRYNCMPWELIDESIFEPPKLVLFKDASEATAEFGTIYE